MAERKPGWWYPYIFVGAFMVVVGVNAAMAYFATSTFTGLETQNPYEKGLAYNTNLAMARAQADMGWTVDVKVEPMAAMGQAPKARVAVSYRDRDGRPVEGLDVRAQMVRPTAKGYDREVAFPATAAGTYGTTVELPLQGVWDMDVVAQGPESSYQFAKRIVIQ